MELAHNSQITFKALEDENIDVFIFTPNDKSDIVINSSVLQKIEKKVLLYHVGQDISFHTLGDKALRGYDLVEIRDDYQKKIDRALSQILNSFEKPGIKLLVDYSYMPALWYSTIINYFVENDPDVNNIQLYFYYSQPDDVKSFKRKPFRFNMPGTSEYADDIRRKPTALVLGLGQENIHKQDFQCNVREANTFAFFPDAAGDNLYSKTLIKNNTRVLRNINNDKLYKYPVSNTEFTYSLLSSVCLDLRLNHNVVIAPMGPKPFSLNCHLLAAQYPDIRVLSEMNSENGIPDGMELNGESIINKVVFCNPEDWDKF